MKKLIAGNWKMNGTVPEARRLKQGIVAAIKADPALPERCDFVVCPPFPHLMEIHEGSEEHTFLALGAQDCSEFNDGAYTGEVSVAMLRDLHCKYVILGHSERRQHRGETDALVRRKAEKVHEYGLITIICVGETGEERAQGREKQVVDTQLNEAVPLTSGAANTVIAYEPVWAIGTGKTAMPDDVRAMHAFIREKLKERFSDGQAFRILYGGSMKPENAADLLATPNVDGGLIGGASLKADQFMAIAKAAQKD